MQLAAMPKYESYRTNVDPWLGAVPSEWLFDRGKWHHKYSKNLNTKRENQNVLSLTLRGVVNNDPNNPEGLIPSDYATYQILESDDLVFKLIDLENIKTSRVGLVHECGIMSSAYIRLTPSASTDPKYLYYFYYHLYQAEVFNKLGSGVRSTLNHGDLLDLQVPVLPIEAQKDISTFLDEKTAKIDEAIAIKERQIALLKERKQIIIQNAVTQGLNPDAPMKDSGVEWIGQIPAHWEVKRLKYVVRVLKRIIGSEGPDVLSITQSGIKIKDIESGEGQLASDYSGYQIVNAGDFAMNHMDLVTGYVDISKYDGVTSPDYRVFENTSDQVDDEYLLRLFQHGYKSRIFFKYGRGVHSEGRWRFPKDSFDNFFIPVPPIEEQRLIAKSVTDQHAKIDKALDLKIAQIVALKEYKATLINSAVTGKIKVV